MSDPLQYILVYLLCVPVFFALDMIWLGLIAPKFYKSQIGHLLGAKPVWSVAVVFYLLFLVGLMIFALVPALEAASWQYALTYGALFGFFTYATYDLTNWATMRGWPPLVSLVDIVWGTVLTGTVAVATYFLAAWLIF